MISDYCDLFYIWHSWSLSCLTVYCSLNFCGQRFRISTSPYCKATGHAFEQTFEPICMQHVIMYKEEKLRIPCLIQNYTRLNITRAISTNPNPHFLQIWQQISPTHCRIPGMQVFYTYVDNFVDRKNKRVLLLCSFYNSGVMKTPQAPGDRRHCSETVFPR